MEFDYAHCLDCGWAGRRSDLIEGDDAITELCPKCSSPDTEWLTEKEYYNHDG